MKTSVKWTVALTVALLVTMGMGRAIVARKAQQSELAQTAANTQPKAIELNQRDLHTVDVLALQHHVPISGSLVAQRSAVIKAKVAAEVLTLKVREGQAVRKGDVIATLDSQEFDIKLKQAKQQAASSKAQWQIAQQTLDNNQALVQQGFISKATLDTSVSNAAATRALYEASQSAVELSQKALKDATVRAPMNGLISQRFTQVGERVAVDGRIVELIDLGSLELQASISPQDLARVSVGLPASLQIDGVSAPVQARVARINPSAANDTRAVTVYLSLPAQASLRQGLFAKGEVQLPTVQGLAVPLSAVARDAGVDQVLRVHAGRVERVGVTLGAKGRVEGQGGRLWIEVRTGLQAGDTVLTDATGTVREGAAVTLPPTASAAR